VARVANQPGHKFTDPAKIDPWHTWLFNPVTKFTDPAKIDPWHGWLFNPVTNLLILLKLTRGTGGYLTQSQIY
jgi:hypothetical protein